MTEHPPGPPAVADIFDALADTYDQTGVDFFQPVGARLVELLEPQPGERALDIGCGRGAATVPLARAVGDGPVTAVDVSPRMVDATRRIVSAEGLRQVECRVVDAAALEPGTEYDVIASSLVLFFLPDPEAALTDWVSRLSDRGRIGVVTFGQRDAASLALDDLLVPWAPPGLLDARTSGTTGPFDSDDGMVGLMHAAGAARVENTTEPVTLSFDDVEAWRRFTMSTGQRAMWLRVPADELPGLLDSAAQILDSVRIDGRSSLVWEMRYTLGYRTS